jgi:uncharacterized protein
VIVSSSLKRRGQIEQPIDPIRVSQFVEAMERSLNADPHLAPPMPTFPVSETL